jgi:predicted deacylase
MPEVPFVDRLSLDDVPPGETRRMRVVMGIDAEGVPLAVPVVVRRSRVDGPVVGITAAMHGNEVNGIRVLHRLFEACPVDRLLRGTLIGVPVVNVPGFKRNLREFHDGADLNRTMPGRPDGTGAQQYAHNFLDRVTGPFDYHIDLHTASFGRVNTLYARVDMTNQVTARLARMMHPEIIVHSHGGDGTLRAAIAERGVPSLTLEVGDPLALQYALIRQSRLGIQEILEQLEMIPDLEDPRRQVPVECKRSYWIYTDGGGILDVKVELAQQFAEGDLIARLTDVWGDVLREYRAPEAGIVVGKSTNPVARPGARVLHLGVIGSV